MTFRGEDVVAGAALLGLQVPPERAGAIAEELARLAARLDQAAMRPALDEVPADFLRAMR